MPAVSATDAPPPSDAGKIPSAISRLVRRTHLYLGLFLMPWLLMYAVSTVLMNHRESVAKFYPDRRPAMVVERELDYSRTFPAAAVPADSARQILRDLGLDGAHRVSGGRDGKPLVIDRDDPLAVRRMTFRPDTGRLTIQREEFRGATFFERLHRRRGYHLPYLADDAWALSVDVTIVAMVFWGLSGIWLWWELRATRHWGAWCGAAGLVLFALCAALL
jgi:hypothetical protein